VLPHLPAILPDGAGSAVFCEFDDEQVNEEYKQDDGKQPECSIERQAKAYGQTEPCKIREFFAGKPAPRK